jgi:hypothetical protein
MMINKFTPCNLEVQMTVLTIKQISDNLNKAEEQDNILEFSQSPEQIEFTSNLMDTLAGNSEKARDVITARLEEEMYANLRSMTTNAVLSVMMENGMGKSLLISAMSGELVGFVDSVTMAIIGTLINEEVL